MPAIKPKKKIEKIETKKTVKKDGDISMVEKKIKELANYEKEFIKEEKKPQAAAKTLTLEADETTKEKVEIPVSKDTPDVDLRRVEEDRITVKEVKSETDQETPVENNKEEQEPLKEVKVVESSSFIARFLIPALVGAVVGIITASGIIIIYNSQYKKETGNKSVQNSVTPPIQPTAAPTDANVLVKDLSLYDIKVLNGSGKSGEAAKVESLLKTSGFAVLEIGNADKSTYKKSVIQAKDKVPQDFLQKLEEILTKSYDIDTLVKLDDKELVDVVVIVGSSPNTQASVSATPKASPTTSQ